MRSLLIDDAREIHATVTARNAEVAKAVLGAMEFDRVYFDHDLGLGKSGYDVMNWMFQRGIYPPEIQLVTMNPVGRENMERALRSEGYEKRGGSSWIRGRGHQ